MDTIDTHILVLAHKGDVILTVAQGKHMVTDVLSVERAEEIAEGLLAQCAVARQQLLEAARRNE